ncbi:hypothetical protein OGAPHI_006073 [Ogataea philodendri]|uniref:Uncharacterized protein n=1 Tax=Ogataea philodendri TaxID=1378263 RepID=A0A9P8T178_9ASCO|nr:uncharacterized protein OGAPHI_006073 [Ogataea philodendri]KAH3661894.1 hypothetical protein OGAPHI_006073 [Ogataea philodendri]
MSLSEFYADESLGGSWADDDIDINSIAVSLHKPADSSSFSRHGDRGQFGQFGHYSSGPDNDRMFDGRGRNDGMFRDLKPPYIAKFTNLPEHSTGKLMIELFGSRFTRFEKCKVLKDPHPPTPRFNISSSGKVERKCAYVQVESVRELQKVLKWNDIFIDRLRINVDIADFQDFMDVQQYNKDIGYDDEAEEKKQAEAPAAPKPEEKRKIATNPANASNGPKAVTESNVANDLNGAAASAQPPKPKPNPFGNAKPVDTASKLLALENQEKTAAAHPVPQPKSNPFGSAKPVDVLSKQLEIEKKLEELAINSTTFKTIAGVEKKKEEPAEKSLSPRKRSQEPSRAGATVKAVPQKTLSKSDSKGRERRERKRSKEPKEPKEKPKKEEQESEAVSEEKGEVDKIEPSPVEEVSSTDTSAEGTKENTPVVAEAKNRDPIQRSFRNTRYVREGEPPLRGRGRGRGRGSNRGSLRQRGRENFDEKWERGDKLAELKNGEKRKEKEKSEEAGEKTESKEPKSSDEPEDVAKPKKPREPREPREPKEPKEPKETNEPNEPKESDSDGPSTDSSRRRGRFRGRGRGRFSKHQYTSLKYVKPGLARNGEPLEQTQGDS